MLKCSGAVQVLIVFHYSVSCFGQVTFASLCDLSLDESFYLYRGIMISQGDVTLESKTFFLAALTHY